MMFFVVINHFSPPNGPEYLDASTLFSATLSARAKEVSTVVVVDGSETRNIRLEKTLERVGVEYHHAGKALDFAAAYNKGIELSDQDWTVLCASDVYPSLSIYSYLESFCAREEAARVGCLIPQLSSSDLAVQRYSRRRRPRKVPLMTLNFNVMKTDYVRSIGGIPAAFSGYYNDVILSRKMFEDGRPIVLLPEKCTHFGSLTVKSGASTLSFNRETQRFRALYPDLYREGSFWNLDLGAFSDAPRIRAVSLLSKLVPVRWRWRATNAALRMIA